jgi:hypothetical protein
MGLDNIWNMPKGKELDVVTFDPPLKLAVGMLTDPEFSFRGKCYASFIREIAGVDLYDDLDNETVLKVAAALERFVAGLSDKDIEWQAFHCFDQELGDVVRWHEPAVHGLPVAQMRDLSRMFRAFGDAGYILVAWF